MKKIPTLFQRDEPERGPRYVRDEVSPGCEWVLDGEGVPTRKLDGVCVLIAGDPMVPGATEAFVRREVKPGGMIPAGFVIVDIDGTTGKTVGWEPASESGFGRYVEEARNAVGYVHEPGTYELLGPKVNGNPEGEPDHVLRRHGALPFDGVNSEWAYAAPPRDFAGLRAFLLDRPFEGIVWHHPDGRMAKLKRRDFPTNNTTGQEAYTP